MHSSKLGERSFTKVCSVKNGMPGREIEKAFVNYFKEHDHKDLPSGPIVVRDDPTLMFNSAGMVQFRNWFQDLNVARYPKVVTSQKCIRAGGKHNDLKEVGFTPRHHTFFRMLGNFSFGDYFKEEAIELAWDFLTKELGIGQSKLSITVHNSDQESRQIWAKILGGESRITDEGDADNFWSMGDSGPCGPCTEIFYDHGKDEPTEIWNLVFMQYNQTSKGRENLAKPCVDTGMGLERITAVMQGVEDNYETDLIYPLIKGISEYGGKQLEIRDEKGHIKPSFKIVADHFISSCFLISEGVQPSNTKEGYVLRKIIRRMFIHQSKLENRHGFSFDSVDFDPIRCLSYLFPLRPLHPELSGSFSLVSKIIERENHLFKRVGFEVMRVARMVTEAKKDGQSGWVEISDGKLTGETIFKMQDTYGMHLEMIEEMCESGEVTVGMDMEGYEACVKEREIRSKGVLKKEELPNPAGFPPTERIENDLVCPVDNVSRSDFTHGMGKVYVLREQHKVHDDQGRPYLRFDKTPFHPQGGGQVGDKGWFVDGDRWIEIKNTLEVEKPDGKGTVIFHEIDRDEGDKIPSRFTGVFTKDGSSSRRLVVDKAHRDAVARGHTATHILNQVLCDLLGEVFQQGSHITAEKFTFDFTHDGSIGKERLKKIEDTVNEVIRANVEVQCKTYENYTEAKAAGAKSLPGESYAKGSVRVLKMGTDLGWQLGEHGENVPSQRFESIELCGGTHVNRTGDIGLFKILGESSISRGVRRLEAMVGDRALAYIQQMEEELEVENEAMRKENSSLRKELGEVETTLRRGQILSAMPKPALVHIPYFVHTSTELLPSDIRHLLIELDKKQEGIHLVHCFFKGKVSLGVTVSKSIKGFHAVKLLEEAVSILGGNNKPSGNEFIAQGGGANTKSLSDALDAVEKQLSLIPN